MPSTHASPATRHWLVSEHRPICVEHAPSIHRAPAAVHSESPLHALGAGASTGASAELDESSDVLASVVLASSPGAVTSSPASGEGGGPVSSFPPASLAGGAPLGTQEAWPP